MPGTSPCPICGAPVRTWDRYPNMLCGQCVGLARDERGRPMRFSNETMLAAGFIAEVDDDGVWRRVAGATYEATCWLSERRCVAREHHFGGIVVQAVDE